MRNQSTSTRDKRVTYDQFRAALDQMTQQLKDQLPETIRQAKERRAEKIKQEAFMRGLRNLFRR